MNKNNQGSQINIKNKRKDRLSDNVFLNVSDEVLKDFFKILDSLKSPEKEKFFVDFCINPSILQ